MRVSFIVLVLIIVLPHAAQAQKAADAQTIAACLKKTEDQGSFGGSCIGLIADPCIKATKDKETYWEDSKACAARELSVWTTLMAEALKRANAGADQKMKAAVAEAQKAFVDARDKFCPVFDKLDPGMVPGGANYCRLQETARRTLNLRRLADAVNEH